MSETTDLASRFVFRLSPLLDLAMAVRVLQQPERFGRPDWTERVRARLPEGLLDRLERGGTDLFALTLALDDRPEPPPVLLARLGDESPQLADDLLVCWQATAPEFAAAATRLADALQADRGRAGEVGPAAFLAGLSDRIRVDEAGDALILQWGAGLRLPLAELDRILLVPSAFCPRRLLFYRDRRTLVLYYAPGAAGAGGAPPEHLLLGHAALADPTRLQLLRLVAAARLPAQEMARHLDVNESTVSRHLRVLLEAGLIARDAQEGRFQFYAVQWRRLADLYGETRAYLTAPGGLPGDAEGSGEGDLGV
ncbi:MAG TPA: metalloregulator ArsR/SmtB family transcription factor [Bacillota bacterium]